jgi:hypothetical protein
VLRTAEMRGRYETARRLGLPVVPLHGKTMGGGCACSKPGMHAARACRGVWCFKSSSCWLSITARMPSTKGVTTHAVKAEAVSDRGAVLLVAADAAHGFGEHEIERPARSLGEKPHDGGGGRAERSHLRRRPHKRRSQHGLGAAHTPYTARSDRQWSAHSAGRSRNVHR